MMNSTIQEEIRTALGLLCFNQNLMRPLVCSLQDYRFPRARVFNTPSRVGHSPVFVYFQNLNFTSNSARLLAKNTPTLITFWFSRQVLFSLKKIVLCSCTCCLHSCANAANRQTRLALLSHLCKSTISSEDGTLLRALQYSSLSLHFGELKRTEIKGISDFSSSK